MGVFADLLASPKTIDTGGADGVRVGGDKVTTREINTLMSRMGDTDYPAAYAAKNEVQSIAIYQGTVSGGTFTLTIKLKGKPTFTTAAIAFNANAATIQAAINTAASIWDWANDNIVVAGRPHWRRDGPITLSQPRRNEVTQCASAESWAVAVFEVHNPHLLCRRLLRSERYLCLVGRTPYKCSKRSVSSISEQLCER